MIYMVTNSIFCNRVSGYSFLNGMGPWIFSGLPAYVATIDGIPIYVGTVDCPIVPEGIPVAVCNYILFVFDMFMVCA